MARARLTRPFFALAYVGLLCGCSNGGNSVATPDGAASAANSLDASNETAAAVPDSDAAPPYDASNETRGAVPDSDAGPADADSGGRPVAANFLDRVDFGNLGTGSTSEGAHHMALSAATNGTGVFGQTYRVIAASTSAPGDPSQNAALTFSLACDAALQTYLTVKLWGGDTTPGLIYLYDTSRGYEMANYDGQSIPEIDAQEDTTPMSPGRFVYVTTPIPMAWTQGKHSVSLTINAAASFSYYGGRTTTQLGAGQTTRPIYSAFSHTDAMLNLMGDDVRTQGTASPATPSTFDATYIASVQSRYKSRIDSYRDATLGGGLWAQAWGSTWDSAVAAGTVPAQVVGLFLGTIAPTDNRTTSAWLDLAATYTSTGNNNPMLRIDDLGQAFVHNLTPSYYQSAELRQRVIAALDAAFYLQSQNGAFGGLSSWVGLGATATTPANPQGRLNAPGNAIEGNGTLALGSAFLNLSADAAFLAALDSDINPSLVPGMKRYQAWGQMFSTHVAFLLGRHGSAPNQDILQARALLAHNQAAKFLDTRYGTTFATTDATILAYVQSACGVIPSSKGPNWFSPAGLSLEVHGVGNGGYDGGYGMNGMVLLVEVAKMLKDAGLETDASHPVRDLALSAVRAFSNFIAPSLTSASVETLRREEIITFRKSFDVGEVGAAASYLAAYDFADPYALHAFHLERLYGMPPPEWSNGNIDEGQNRMFRWGTAYLGLVQNAVTTADGGTITDPSRVSFLHESSHPDGVWLDPVAGALTFKQNDQHGFVVLNFRPFGYGDATAYVQPSATGMISNVARVHVLSPSADRVATVSLPTSAATGASAGFSSGPYGAQYLLRYGPYVAALNLASSAASLAVPMNAGAASAFEWVTGSAVDLTNSQSVSIAPSSGILLTLGASPFAATSASALAY